MVSCPQCEVPMNPVTAKANPGTLIQLDQCGQCGGIWCDKWELFPIDPDEAERVDAVDEKLLTNLVTPAAKTLYCPRLSQIPSQRQHRLSCKSIGSSGSLHDCNFAVHLGQ